MTGSTLDLSQRLASILGYLEASAKSAGQFATEQTPLLIQEILRFKLWMNAFELVFIPILGYALYRLIRWHYLWSKAWAENLKNRYEDPWVGMTLAVILAYAPTTLFLISWLFGTIHALLMITLAPRLYLIQYVANFIK